MAESTNNTTPRTTLRDAVLADLSDNVDSDDVLTAIESVSISSARLATIHGPGMMVDFEDYNGVEL